MRYPNGTAPDTAPAVSEGQIEDRKEGLLDTKSKPNLATILGTMAELFRSSPRNAGRGTSPLRLTSTKL
jgi:hypothetical protein